MFNNVTTEKDRKDLKEITESFNLDIYGYSNDQAFVPLGGSSMRSNIYNAT